MNQIKSFLANKTPGFYVSACACLLGLIGLLVYTIRGGNYLSPVNGVAVALLILGVASNIGVLVKDFSILGIIPVALYSAAFAVLFNTEMLFLTNVAFGVDGNVIDFGWVFFFIMIILAVLFSAVSYGMGLSKPKNLAAEK